MTNRLAALREARGLSQRELAARVNTTNQHISRLETGRAQLTQAWLERLAPVLNCSPAEIVGWTAEPSAMLSASDHHGAVKNRIAERRQARGLTQAALGELVGVRSGQIAKLELGSVKLSQDWMRRLSRALHCAPADLLPPEDHASAAPRLPTPRRSAPDHVTVADLIAELERIDRRSIRAMREALLDLLPAQAPALLALEAEARLLRAQIIERVNSSEAAA